MVFRKVSEMPFPAIRLAGGIVMPAPAGSVMLNGEKEGESLSAWCVWVYDTSRPCDARSALRGESERDTMIYFSDRDDLYKFGQHEPAVFVDAEDAEDCRHQVVELQELALSCINKSAPLGDGACQISWAELSRIFESMHGNGKETLVEIGTSFPFERNKD